MINGIARFFCLLSLILINQKALADLNSPTYKKAKEAYETGNCKIALKLLQEYESVDADFLDAHPNVKDNIEGAISYCKEYVPHSMHFIGSSGGIDTNSREITSTPNSDLPSKTKLP